MNSNSIKFIVVLGLFGSLVGCSSAPKESKSSEKEVAAPWENEPPVEQETTAPAAKQAPATKAAAVDSSDATAELNAAIKSQNDEKILATAHDLLKKKANDVKALNALGVVAYRKGRFELATYFFDKALQKSPEQSDIHSNLGLVQLARKETGAAVKSFRHALQSNPNNGGAAANLGAIYVAEQDYPKAVTALEIAYRQGFKDPKVLNNYGIALAATGQGEKALGIYEETAKLSPNNREVLFNEAILLIDLLGRPKDGLDLIERLKLVGVPMESRERLSSLENKAKAGLK